MQVLIQVICKSRVKSLREQVDQDASLNAHGLEILSRQKPGRNPGWTKIRLNSECRASWPGDANGVINLEWDADSKILFGRVIARSQYPAALIKAFIGMMLLEPKYRKHIESVNLLHKNS